MGIKDGPNILFFYIPYAEFSIIDRDQLCKAFIFEPTLEILNKKKNDRVEIINNRLVMKKQLFEKGEHKRISAVIAYYEKSTNPQEFKPPIFIIHNPEAEYPLPSKKGFWKECCQFCNSDNKWGCDN